MLLICRQGYSNVIEFSFIVIYLYKIPFISSVLHIHQFFLPLIETEFSYLDERTYKLLY